SEEHTSELQSPCNLVCRLLLEKKQHSRKAQVVAGWHLASSDPADEAYLPSDVESDCGVQLSLAIFTPRRIDPSDAANRRNRSVLVSSYTVPHIAQHQPLHYRVL